MNDSIDLSEASVEDIALLMKVMAKMKDKQPVELQKQPEATAEVAKMESLVRQLTSVGGKQKLTKATAPKKPGRPKKHWKAKKKRIREYKREYMNRRYKMLIGPRRKKLAADGSWYEYYLGEWKKRGFQVELPQAEWDEVVRPLIGDRIPTVVRLNTGKPVALYNLIIKDSETKETIFDGTDWMLNKLGIGTA